MSAHDSPPASERGPAPINKGPLAWMAKNAVAANLLMLALMVGGLLFIPRIKQEVFPEFELDMITVSVVYPGASPTEVERGVTLAVEEAVRGIDGVKEVTSTSAEGVSMVMVELLLNANGDRALADVKSAVDRITSFPAEVERPVVSLLAMQSEVVSLVIYGDASEAAIRALAEKMRDELLQNDGITTVDLTGVRAPEISVEVPRDKLRQYNLTLDQIAMAIRAASVELPGGAVKTEGGEVLLRTQERRDHGQQFEDIEIVSLPDGSRVLVRDVAKVVDGFAETDQETLFNGKRAAMVRVFRVGDQTPIGVSDIVHTYLAEHKDDLPPGIELAVWNDRSDMYRQRIDLLLRNAYMGLALVLLSLGMFLQLRLAFWVTMGIPISFLGSLLFLPAADISLNMISLFAFIVTLGIVVDDAIVVGEAVFNRRRDGLGYVKAAVAGTQEVAVPVVFSVLTTVAAFSPLLFVPGVMGKFFRNIPVVVITVLMISLAESLFILPAHLAHTSPPSEKGVLGFIHRQQTRFSEAFERFAAVQFGAFVVRVVRNRYITIAGAICLLLLCFGYMAGGRIDFTFMPKIQMDVVFVQLKMPFGTPASETKVHLERMIRSAEEVLEAAGGADKNSRGMFSTLGSANFGGMRADAAGSSGSHLAEVSLFMVPMDQRNISAADFANQWRERIGDIEGADSLKFTFTSGASSQPPISVQLSHTDVATLEAAANQLAGKLRTYSGVKDIDDGVSLGKRQLNFKLEPEARALGITETELGRQVRSAFYGAEAVRQQRGRDELRTFVRLPRAERSSLHDIDEMLIRTRDGAEIPLGRAAKINAGRAYTEIKRTDGRRVIEVTADVEESTTNANKVMEEIEESALPELGASFPGLSYGKSGQQADQAESLNALKTGFLLALIAMFALMAVPLKSYSQPLIIMTAIPFGIVGALGGHVLMGYDLSVLSMMGLVALSGVAVNDSLVLISAINDFRAQGMSPFEAVVAGATRRFRPILLTSLTTFLGLAPMILETSMQARFLIPMALSLGFGVLFSTFVTLLLVPSLYLALVDIRRRLGLAPPTQALELDAPVPAE